MLVWAGVDGTLWRGNDAAIGYSSVNSSLDTCREIYLSVRMVGALTRYTLYYL